MRGKTATTAIIIGFIFTIFLIAAMLIKTSNYSSSKTHGLHEITLKIDKHIDDGDRCYLRGHFSTDVEDGELLYLCPSNIEVKFSVNGRLVYEFVKDKDGIMSTPGKDVAMLDLGKITIKDTIEFELYAPGISMYEADVFEEFYNSIIAGNGQSIYQYLISDKWIGIVVSLLLMFLGIGYCAYSLIYYRGHYSEVKINLAFGVFSLSVGAYIFIDSLGNLLPLLLPNPLWCSLLEISFLYLSLASMVSYLYVCTNRVNIKKIQFALIFVVLINLIIILLGELFGAVDMYSMKEFMETLLIVWLGLSVLAGVLEMFDSDSFQTRRFFISSIPIAATTAVTVFFYLTFKFDVHVVMYVGMLSTIAMLALGIASDSRIAQKNLAFMTKQMIAKKEQLDMALLQISESKHRAEKLVLDKEFAEAQMQVDSMTGLYNKASMEKMVSNYLQNNSAENVALIFVDLDHFKSLNDTLGHMTGDEAIKDAAKKLTVFFRKYDLVSRFGGDEFCVFLRSINKETLLTKLGALVQNLASSYTNGTDTVYITASVGCAYCICEKADYSKMIKLADRAVYEVKESGRNGFVILDYSDNSLGELVLYK